MQARPVVLQRPGASWDGVPVRARARCRPRAAARRPAAAAAPDGPPPPPSTLQQQEQGALPPLESAQDPRCCAPHAGLVRDPATGELQYAAPGGERVRVLPADYGFRSGAGRLYQAGYGSVPGGAAGLAAANFRKELRALRRSVRWNEYREIAAARGGGGGDTNIAAAALARAGGAARRALARLDAWLEGGAVLGELPAPRPAAASGLAPEERRLLRAVRALSLDDAGVAAREAARLRAEAAAGAPPRAPWPVRAAYASLCWVLDVIYAGRPIPRFWVLETVARVPYFAYITTLHLYESLGWWRAGAELRRVHFAEEWNELHHLQIMEALGGDLLWADRFIAEHAAVAYFWALVLAYMVSPPASYAFAELVEGHAADTYSEFVAQNAGALAAIPPPAVAVAYYRGGEGGDLYLFDAFATGGGPPRRPRCDSLLDVFTNIRDDELEHRRTMIACADGTFALGGGGLEAREGGGAAAAGAAEVSTACAEDVCDFDFDALDE